jgi:gamma-glutamyltranspeptidase/glutathione hydrolase
VAAQHRRAAEAGAAILSEGGDAVDAVIATSFALGVLGAVMSGIGGGGAMVLIARPRTARAIIDFGMRGRARSVARLFLSRETGVSDLFPGRVKDDRNARPSPSRSREWSTGCEWRMNGSPSCRGNS